VPAEVRLFGIRHHGPGCARGVLQALENYAPDTVLIEAPADAEPVFAFAIQPEMRPPVALLISADPRRGQSIVLPFVEFSPEWQALVWGLKNGAAVHAIDFPMSHRFALDDSAIPFPAPTPFPAPFPDPAPDSTSRAKPVADSPAWRTDPLALLADADGHSDPELWWEELIERRGNLGDVFEAILTAMFAVREHCPEVTPLDLTREAWMRQAIRRARRASAGRVAVVCGAFHAPVLQASVLDEKRSACSATADRERLKSLPRVKTTATWIPWTLARLAWRSGYGAGVESPGWYRHLWTSPAEAGPRWIVQAAQLLRREGLDASPASVIETRRLADALAAMRHRPGPGLIELREALQAVLCRGEPAPLQRIRDELELGRDMGTVASAVPAVPLAEDLRRLQKSLRLRPEPAPKVVSLDLRTPRGRQRSLLLHRLGLLNIPWGVRQEASAGFSTFRETWTLQWQPEFAIELIAANLWGNTVEEAAAGRTLRRVQEAETLPELVQLVGELLLADLPSPLPAAIESIQARAAVSTDVLHLVLALPQMARVLRYGDVRDSNLMTLEQVARGMIDRILAGIVPACSGIDVSQAREWITALAPLETALQVLEWNEALDSWRQCQKGMIGGAIPGLLQGWCCRRLLEAGLIDIEELGRFTQLALSRANPVEHSATWLEGLLTGSGLLLLEEQRLWQVLDLWVQTLSPDDFQQGLPLLRRAFSTFAPAERRQMGELLRRMSPAADGLPAVPVPAASGLVLHPERADRVLPVLALILGVSDHG